MRPPSHLARFLGSVGFLTIAAVGLAGCQTTLTPDITGSLGTKASSVAAPETQARGAIEAYGEKYRANPKDLDNAMRYGQALRANGQREQAVAVLEQINLTHPGNRVVLGAYGRALAENGNFKLAFDVLSRAHTPANPDWRILSIQGAVLDQMGKPEEARRYYASALKIKPDDPSVLSNLGLSYVLTKELPKAEATLRHAQQLAPGDSRIRQNLGLALGLQGRFAEAEAIVQADLPPEEAAANVAYLKDMLSSGQAGKTAARPRSTVPPRS
jgi:Flp pilus assembly protein TadD